MIDYDNLSLLADFYEFSMGNGFLDNGDIDSIAYFDMYFRKVPDDGGFAIFAGLEQVINYIENLRFTKEDIENAYKKFYMRDKSRSSQGHYGMGLYICEIICKKHGGEINLGNNISGGACVQATFNIE